MIKKPAKKSVNASILEALTKLNDRIDRIESGKPAVKTAGKTKEVNRYESISYPGVKLWKSNPDDKESFCFAELVNDELDGLQFQKDEYKSKKRK